MSHSMDQREPGASPTHEPSTPALDVDVLHDLLASLSQPVAVAAVYRKFAVNAADFIRELPKQDRAARIETLHTLKGSAAMMGAKSLAQVAARLQSEAETSSVQVVETIEELNGELAKFRLAVAARLSELGAPLDPSGLDTSGEP
jgi:HPt (histidine-containing phosphotransfer) domain-containing protein